MLDLQIQGTTGSGSVFRTGHRAAMLLDALQLSESARPILLNGEVERLIVNKVDLDFVGEGGVSGATANIYKEGRLVLTSHRILWVDSTALPAPGNSCFLPLSSIHSWRVSKPVSAWMQIKAPKLKFDVYQMADGRPAPGGLDAIQTKKIAAICNDGISDAFSDQLKIALEQKTWLNALNPPAPAPSDGFAQSQTNASVNPTYLQQLTAMGFTENRATRALMATKNQGVAVAMDWILAYQHDPSLDAPLQVPQASKEASTVNLPVRFGVSAILKRQEEQAKQTQQSLSQAFQDLRALMGKAEEMVKLAERFRSRMGSGSAGGEDEALDEETMNEMISMGIASPVTKETAGALYHQELARQLADFLKDPLNRAGGLMTLPDVYCRFNRARGAELVSPDDLIAAANLFPKVSVPLRLKAFPSGVSVIQSSSHNEEEVCKQIGEIVGDSTDLGRAITASDVAVSLQVPITIAQEHLLLAEEHGVLCRDDGPEGIRFFRNFFKAVEWVA